MIYVLIVAAVLHAGFMGAELFPWGVPALLAKASESSKVEFNPAQQNLVAAIVHNAGIYNGILAGGFLWAAFHLDPAMDLARVLLCGAFVAGVFGAITMKTWVPLLQAAVGLLGLIFLAI